MRLKALFGIGLLTLTTASCATRSHQSRVEAWAPEVDRHLVNLHTVLLDRLEQVDEMEDAICAWAEENLPPDEVPSFCGTDEPPPPEPPCSFGSCRGED